MYFHLLQIFFFIIIFFILLNLLNKGFQHRCCDCECYWQHIETLGLSGSPCLDPVDTQYLLTYHFFVDMRPNQIFQEIFLQPFSMIKQLSYPFSHDAIVSERFSGYYTAHINSLTSNWPEFSSRSSTINQILLNQGQFRCLSFILENLKVPYFPGKDRNYICITYVHVFFLSHLSLYLSLLIQQRTKKNAHSSLTTAFQLQVFQHGTQLRQ